MLTNEATDDLGQSQNEMPDQPNELEQAAPEAAASDDNERAQALRDGTEALQFQGVRADAEAAVEDDENEVGELVSMYGRDWTAPLPEHFDIADQPPAKKLKSETEITEAEAGNDQCSSSEAGNGPAEADAQDAVAGQADWIEELEDLIHLEENGESVGWPPGMSATLARRAVHEWNVNRGPPTKRAKGEQHERENIGGSAPGIVSANAAPFVQVAPLNPFPAPEHPLRDAMHLFGRYHDLRQSGMVIWCRSCGRFGEERLQKGRGLGGNCLVVTHGPKHRAHTQLNLLRDGFHPRTKARLPPEFAFER